MFHLSRIRFLFFFITVISQAAQANQNSQSCSQIINRILVKGMCCSGKSAACKLLSQELKDKKRPFQSNYIFISEKAIVKPLLNKAISQEGTEDSDLFYAAGTLLDQSICKPKPDVLYIQDRNWLSQDSWVSFVCCEKNYAPKDYFLRNLAPFEWNIFLTLSFKTFQDKFEKRSEKKFLNELMYKSNEYFDEYQKFCLSRIPDNENWLVINTDNLSPEEVVDMIINYSGLR